jgi:hypothetical protein
MDAHILQSLDFPDCRAVLFDWSSNKEYRFENLVCLNGDGSLRWKAELPKNSGPDCFVGIALDNSQLRANTWSGFALWLDLLSRRVLKSAFTK